MGSVSFTPEEFLEARQTYRNMRHAAKLQLREFLRLAGFRVSTSVVAGQGRRTYTNHGSDVLSEYPLDLSNVKWIDAERDGITVCVFLQALDIDTDSHNTHGIDDRIMLQIFRSKQRKPLTSKDWPDATTKFELPLSETDFTQLRIEIEDRVSKFINTESGNNHDD